MDKYIQVTAVQMFEQQTAKNLANLKQAVYMKRRY